MALSLRTGLLILYRAGDRTVDHDGIEMAGYLSFLSMLALFPFLVLMVAMAGFIGQGEAGAEMIAFVLQHLPPEAVNAIRPRIDEIISGPPQGLLTISILGAIWTASSALEGLRMVLNRAYHVSNPPTYWLRRLTSIVQIVLFTAVIIVIMLVLVFTPIVLTQIERITSLPFSPEIHALWNDYFLYTSAFILFLMVANLYYILPNIRQHVRSVVPGALLTVLLWIGAAKLFTIYITNVDQVSLIYGSLGGIIATLLFFFIMNIIFIYGAEFNYQLQTALGHRIEERERSAQS